VSYRSPEGDEIFSRKALVIRYLKTWFIVDLLSVLPFQAVHLESDSALLVLRGYKLSKLARVLR
jgi:hypothetical protein